MLFRSGKRYPTLLAPIQDDLGLVRACLEQFFAGEDSVTGYSDYLDQRWLEGVLAETKLLAGVGDPERWYSLLNDPARLEQRECSYGLNLSRKLKIRVCFGVYGGWNIFVPSSGGEV